MVADTQNYTDGSRDSGEDVRGLDELQAPPPLPFPKDNETASDVRRGRPSSELYLEDQGEDTLVESAPEPRQDPTQRPSEHVLSRERSRWRRLLNELHVISHLIFFALLGTLARLGLQWLTFYPGAPVTTSVLWANVGGSFFMGFLSEDRQLFQFPSHLRKPSMTSSDLKAQHNKHKKTIPLYIGLTTGFCGSFTSFSSFMRDAFLALSNDLPSPYNHPLPSPAPSFSTTQPRNAGYSVLAPLAILLIEPALSLSALFVGAHTALALSPLLPSLRPPTLRILDPLLLPLALLAWLATIILTILTPNTVWRGEALFALVFAPLGSLLRFYASLHLNPRIKAFPLGTFVVNILGTAVLGMSYGLQRVRLGAVAGGSVVGCQVLQGVEDGFCGCLTTVSTWVAELQGLRRRDAYVYGLVSVAVGLAVLVVVMGSVRWGVGWTEPVCVTGRTSS